MSVPTCPGLETFFTNTTLPGVPPLTSYLWDFGDGASSTDENPTHLFAAPGTYEVTLEACNIEGMCNSFTDTVEALALPAADFSFAVTGLGCLQQPTLNATSCIGIWR
jgi:hypothetical protein